jgi:hypothetical protein
MQLLLGQVAQSVSSSGWDRVVSELLSRGRFDMIAWGVFIVVLVIIVKVNGTIRHNARERTRREIAAYIAEGSMTPEQGERLMKVGRSEA